MIVRVRVCEMSFLKFTQGLVVHYIHVLVECCGQVLNNLYFCCGVQMQYAPFISSFFVEYSLSLKLFFCVGVA